MGQGTSGPLQPGTYAVQPRGDGVYLAMISVTVRSGENTEAELRLSESVRRKVLLPVVPSRGMVVTQVWTDSAGEEVRHHSSILSNVDSPIEEDLLLVPGTYLVELIGPFGRRSTTEVVVDARTEGSSPVVLNPPWE